jgi:hypothetical protein
MTLHSVANLIFGLVFTWLVLSLAAMYLQEMIASKLRWRQKMLESTIRNMLVDSAYADQFYNHPLIRSLYSGSGSASKPSYIPSNQFALALIDIISASGSEASLIQQQIYKLLGSLDTLNKKQRKAAQGQLGAILALARRALVSEISAATNTLAIEKITDALDILANEVPGLKSAIERSLKTINSQKKQIAAILASSQEQKVSRKIDTTFEKIRAGVTIMAVTNPGLKQTLQSLFNGYIETSDQTEGDTQHLGRVIETWFNDSMDRLTGWYTRRAQVLSIIIGVLLGVTANIDSLKLADYLWREPVVGNALALQAENYLQSNQGEFNPPTANQIITLHDQLYATSLPIGWIGSPVYIVASNDLNATPVCTRTPRTVTDIYGLMLADICYPVINAPHPDNTTGWIFKGIGLLITALATSKGAPFWFDVLNKIINVRLAGVNPSQMQQVFG